MDTTTNFTNLLNSQTIYNLDPPELDEPEPSFKERRHWSPTEDIILIGAWLNTSKDPVVGNQQKATRFWKRIKDYYNASPLLVGTTPREIVSCKQRWGRINDQVCKFADSYEAALRDQKSGQNDDNVVTAALKLYENDYKAKFTLEHAWRELRHDSKWCSSVKAKDTVKDKRKEVPEVAEQGESSAGRPVGVKAAKAAIKKKKNGKEEDLSKLQVLFELKERVSKQKLLDRLLAKPEPLCEMETSLKLKLMSDML